MTTLITEVPSLMEDNNMLSFSVLMSLYHKENPENLALCLESVFKNTLQPSEVIIVFDGPLTQELEDVVIHFKLKYDIKVVRLTKNQGLGIALNEGLLYCNNEWVFRMDTDDYCVPSRFQDQALRILSDPNIAIIGGFIEEYDESLKYSSGMRTVPTTHDEIINGVKFRSPFNHMTVAFKKSAVLAVGSYQHHYCMEDYNLWIRLLANGYKAQNIDKVLVKARAGNSMINRRKGTAYLISEVKLAKLKYTLRLQSLWSAGLTCCLRSLPRLLPLTFLKLIYTLLRKK